MGAHKLHLYTGGGKGKTTAAMGLALRALGHGQRVLVAQFLKDGATGELAALKRLAGITVYPPAEVKGFFYEMNEAAREETRHAETERAKALAVLIAQARPETVILDELAVAADTGAVEEWAARDLVAAALREAETVVTGASAPAWLIEMSDYLSEITARKHPYAAENLPARPGVEW